MKLHLSRSGGRNLFTGHGEGYVTVNDQRFERSVIVTPDEVRPWRPENFGALNESDFAALLELKPEIVILGTGRQLQFPHPALTKALASAQVGLEVMDTGAACRTYNFLMAEGRQVVAALLV